MKKLICLMLMICTLSFADEIPLDLEIAKTEKARTFGLMQRKNLGENEGMLFVYPTKEYGSIWMFNCYLDLSVAFLDEKGTIREIHELKAYPEKMDPSRKVLSYQDLGRYSMDDPIIHFFYNKRVTSSFLASFALEMNAGWFYNHRVSIGDLLIWDEKTGNATIVRKNVTSK